MAKQYSMCLVILSRSHLASLAKDLRMACFCLTIPIPPPAREGSEEGGVVICRTNDPLSHSHFKKAPETRCFLKLNSVLIDL